MESEGGTIERKMREGKQEVRPRKVRKGEKRRERGGEKMEIKGRAMKSG